MALIDRLARSEVESVVAVARAMRAERGGEVAAEPVGEGALVALGAGRYVNRAFATGTTLSDDDLDRIDRFFTSRGLAPSVQMSTRADADTVDRLTRRGFHPAWFRSVFASPFTGLAGSLASGLRTGAACSVTEVDDADLPAWLDALADGNGLCAAADREISAEFGRAAHRAAGSLDLIARVDGEVAGCGSVQFASGVAWLGGAATRPPYRGRGVQAALLDERLRRAAARGCDLAAATALPGSTSARNIERAGLRLVDVQVVMTRASAV